MRFNIADGINGNSQPFGGIVAHSRGGVLENRDYAVAGSVMSVRQRLVNELRFQVARRDQDVRSLDPACGGPCIGPAQGGPALEVVGVARVGRHNFTPAAAQQRPLSGARHGLARARAASAEGRHRRQRHRQPRRAACR